MTDVLLLEPNPLLADAYRQFLVHAGFSVRHVTTGQAAIDAADEQVPGVIVLELQLPRHNGIEFLHELRSYPEWRDLPVVVNTIMPPHKLAAAKQPLQEALGVRAILYKPTATLADLLRAVREHMAAA
jgi:CheY-like chemotaxis protein